MIGMHSHLYNAVDVLHSVDPMKKRTEGSTQGSKDNRQEQDSRRKCSFTFMLLLTRCILLT